MNLLEGNVTVEGDDVGVVIAGQAIPLAAETLRRYPGVRGYKGRRVVFGVRSDELYLPSERPGLPLLNAELQLVEQLGSHSMAYFKIDAMAIRAGSTGLEDIDEAPADAEGVIASRPNLVASFSPLEAQGLRLHENVPIAVDVAKATCSNSTRVNRSGSAIALASVLAAAVLAAVAAGAGPGPPTGAELAALAQPPTYSSLAAQRIYFVMPDRYANGDPANDRGGVAGNSSRLTGFAPADPAFFHGGDYGG